ncbi:MAG: response regulator [Thermodesulfobacteriota bacterium]
MQRKKREAFTLKILVVEDELTNRMVLQKLLQEVGECELAENGEDGLTIAMSDNPPDLVLLDIVLPGIGGFDVCKKLKADPKTKEIPVIFVSGKENIKDITKGFMLGAVDYITKPFHKEEVKARVETHLSLKKMREDLYKKNTLLKRQVIEIEEKTEQLREKDLQLVKMDRIAGIGTLAAGIAHEINNPLSFIKTSTTFLKKSINKTLETVKYWDDKPLPEVLAQDYKDYLDGMNFDHVINSMDKKLEFMQEGIERIMKIINSLRKFSRVDKASFGNLNINESIEDSIEILSSQNTGGIEFLKNLGEIPPVNCSPSEINQCLLHVIKNALDAVDQKGTVELMTSLNEKGDHVVIRIKDNGKGMTPDELRQALTPFFTTKAVGSGTGVGLSITETIIKSHSGTIDISSKEGEGTTVTISLPLVGKSATS